MRDNRLLIRWPEVVLMILVLSTTVDGDCAPEYWEGAICQYEEKDKTDPPPPQPIVFVGSSSIVMWESLSEDFPDLPVINRGFGGCEMGDVVFYAKRILVPYHPRAVVVYAGDNDLANGKTPEKILSDCEELVKIIHDSDTTTRVGFILVKPSPSRWHLEAAIRQVNEKIKELCGRHKNMFFVDVFTPMLDPNGKPRTELFLEDQLHMNREAYQIWRDLVGPHLRPEK